MIDGRPADRPRIVLLGTDSAYTLAALQALVVQGQAPVALLRPRRVPGDLGVRAVPPQLGQSSALPVYELGRLDHPEAEALREQLAPDLLVAACHPRRVPASWLRAPARGAWNIHPSLLPAYRGPVPVFWQLRAGETRTGVTVHRMDAGFDTGPVLARRAVSYPEGARAHELDALLAHAGAALVAERLARRDVIETAQDASHATAQGFPEAGDLDVPLAWPAWRAFDFVRGALPWGPLALRVGERRLVVVDALSWEEPTPPQPLAISGDDAVVAFASGAVRFRLG